MLTEEAMFQRKWGGFPALAAALGNKQSTHWTGLTSVSYSTTDRLDDLLDIYALVMDNKTEIGQLLHSQTGDLIGTDLVALSEALGSVSGFLARLSHETRDILAEPR